LAVTRLARLIWFLDNIFLGTRSQIKWHVIVYDFMFVLLESTRRCRTDFTLSFDGLSGSIFTANYIINLPVKIYCEI
jgi:hypothetical protein